MKTAKEALLEFVKAKNRIIFATTGLEMFNSEDYDDLLSWTEKECLKILQRMAMGIYSDNEACPWCEKYRSKSGSHGFLRLVCNKCSYGKRHGQCIKSPDSLYRKIVTATNGGFDGVKGILSNSKIKQQLESALEDILKDVKGLDK